MKKLILNLESLSVESFETSAEAQIRRGTVQGHNYDPDGDELQQLPTVEPMSEGGSCHIGWSCWGGCQIP